MNVADYVKIIMCGVCTQRGFSFILRSIALVVLVVAVGNLCITLIAYTILQQQQEVHRIWFHYAMKITYRTVLLYNNQNTTQEKNMQRSSLLAFHNILYYEQHTVRYICTQTL